MAANLDKSESSLTSVSSVSYVRALDSSGNSVKISTSDLASVLGASKIQITSGQDLNTLRKAGVFYACASSTITTTLLNRPSNMPNMAFGMIVVPTPLEENYCRQIIFCERGEIFNRYIDSNVIGDWQQIYDTSLLTNQTLLSPLASALGAKRYAFTGTITTDIYTPTEPGGKTLLALISTNHGGTSSTGSLIVMIRCFRSNKEIDVTTISSSGETITLYPLTIDTDDNGYLRFTCASNLNISWKVLVIVNQ